MADKTNQTKLFEEFPPITTEQWEAQIIKDLKGADYEKSWFGKPSKDSACNHTTGLNT